MSAITSPFFCSKCSVKVVWRKSRTPVSFNPIVYRPGPFYWEHGFPWGHRHCPLNADVALRPPGAAYGIDGAVSPWEEWRLALLREFHINSRTMEAL